ncbi:hypothetical protein BU24DRAFT_55335 [Aaosphaeria arxii CBS 175.79]|uniref:Uncharacterized protein n=1 Tax=Aaosphaeria arxii CBS 175.79 TaxID=1450172 RepID=A0A6A5XBJ4_9PLEO|nr:uncharacterized protein BU24DRAFT_55335 [Aaosphaeria arxii CBS 175.79]KAF2010301.1 hypothetical protein BU24DRAFT_55335 [Aaosphaeria arxii CBS 175.79]
MRSNLPSLLPSECESCSSTPDKLTSNNTFPFKCFVRSESYSGQFRNNVMFFRNIAGTMPKWHTGSSLEAKQTDDNKNPHTTTTTIKTTTVTNRNPVENPHPNHRSPSAALRTGFQGCPHSRVFPSVTLPRIEGFPVPCS